MQPRVDVHGKEEPALWPVDGLLWAFGRFARGEGENNVQTPNLHFERFRYRFRKIRDLRNPSLVYTRRKPFTFGAFKDDTSNEAAGERE